MSQDTLSEVLRNVRLRGAVFYRVGYGPEWAAEVPPAREIAGAVFPGAEHVIEYHMLVKGDAWAGVLGEKPIRVSTGDVVMFPQGDAHVMSSAPGMRAERMDVDWVYATRNDLKPIGFYRGVELSPAGEPLEETRSNVVCGFLACDARPFNPLLATLPRMLHLPASADRFVGKALSLLHARPAEPWTIEALAEAVGLSRSALHERFVTLVGLPPMQYLAHWRMQLGARLLRESSAPVASVALDVGYESEAAFARAFKRLVGAPPAAWRRAQLAGTP